MTPRAARMIPMAAALLLSLAAHASPAVYPNPGTEAPAPGAFVADASGQLVAYFTGERGGYTNLAGVRINGVDGAIGLNNQTSAYGDKFVLGQVTAGDNLVFFIDVNAGAVRYYSDPSLNPDGTNHVWAAHYAGDSLVPAGTNLAFEDLDKNGDFNYRDHSFVFQISAVPEPASWMLMLGGVAGLAAWRRRGR